jgi:cytochrome c oxidase assembly factor CtaG
MTWRHRAALTAGLVLLTAGFLADLSGVTDQRLSLRMGLEMMLVGVVAPLAGYGAGPLFRRGMTFHPVLGIIALNLVVFLGQLPLIVDRAARNSGLRGLVLTAVVIGAFLFWSPIVGAGPLSSIAKVGTLMVASVPPTIPGLTMALSHHLFYQAYRSIEDQQVAGLILFGTAKFALVGGAFVVLWRLLTPGIEPDDDDDRDQPADEMPPISPAWLRHLDGELPSEAARPREPALSALPKR